MLEGIRNYTGVGSRDVSQQEFSLMVKIAQHLAKNNVTLRSGGAQGADTAFEQGCAYKKGHAEIFIPWRGFGNKLINPNSKRYIPTESKFSEARYYLIDNNIIPWFEKMKQGAQKLHLRNYYQVLGVDNNPSDILVYCSDDVKEGIPKGGTRTAVILARSFDIPTYNIRNFKQKVELLELLGITE